MDSWMRIPASISDESDRRSLCAILCAYGLEARIVRVRETSRGGLKRYVEYRSPEERSTPSDGKNE